MAFRLTGNDHGTPLSLKIRTQPLDLRGLAHAIDTFKRNKQTVHAIDLSVRRRVASNRQLNQLYLRFKGLIWSFLKVYFRFEGLLPK